MRKGSKMTPKQKAKLLGRVPWNKGQKLGNLYPNSGQFRKGQKRPKGAGMKKGKIWSAEEREKNRQGQYRRFEREIPNYQFEDEGRRIRRKVRLRQNGGFHSRGEWENLKAQFNWTCPSCRKSEPEISLTKDHIIAVIHGGTDNIENIQPLCKPCNSRKHSKDIRYLGRA